jgi:hypothetical protein
MEQKNERMAIFICSEATEKYMGLNKLYAPAYQYIFNLIKNSDLVWLNEKLEHDQDAQLYKGDLIRLKKSTEDSLEELINKRIVSPINGLKVRVLDYALELDLHNQTDNLINIINDFLIMIYKSIETNGYILFYHSINLNTTPKILKDKFGWV